MFIQVSNELNELSNGVQRVSRAKAMALNKKRIRLPRTQVFRDISQRDYFSCDYTGIVKEGRIVERVNRVYEMTSLHRQMVMGIKLAQLETLRYLVYRQANGKTGYAISVKQVKDMRRWHNSGM